MRLFGYCFILLIVFFSGMTLGIKQEQTITSGNHSEHYIEEQSDPTNTSEIIGREIDSYNHEQPEQIDSLEGPSPFTQKTAIVLESSMKFVSNIVVEILYQIANLFF